MGPLGPNPDHSATGPTADIGHMHARIRLTFAPAFWLLTALLPAQQVGTKPKPTPSPGTQKPIVPDAPKPATEPIKPTTPVVSGEAPMDRELDAMRQQLVDGRVFRSHVRVTVRLKNGNRVNGVVKDGFVIERIDGMRFVGAEASEEGAGVRIYTYNGRRNYIFIAFGEMEEYRINARLDTQELALFERKVRDDEQARLKQRAAVEGSPAVPAVEGETAPDSLPVDPAPAAEPTPTTEPIAATEAPKAKPPSVTDELQAMFTLLQDYPPADGWNAQKRDEIARRKAVVGANPSAKEQKFVDSFGAWERACAVLGSKTEAKEAPAATESAEKSSRRGKKNR